MLKKFIKGVYPLQLLFLQGIFEWISEWLFLKEPLSRSIRQRKLPIYYSTGASDRSFYPIFNKRFDHLETLLTTCRPKKVLSARSLCGPLVPSSQSKCPKRTYMLPEKYHVSVSNMLSKPLKCLMENEN